MEACIIACGYGSRLHPFTLDRPKALIPLGETTVLTRQLDQLQRWGIERVTLLHRDDLAPALVSRSLCPGDRSRLRIGTAPFHWPGVYAWLRARYETATGPVLTLNCDLVLSAAWGDILAEHVRTGAALTLAATPRPGPEEGQYGRPRILAVTSDGQITITRVPDNDNPAAADGVVAHQIGVSVVSPPAWPYLTDLPHQAEDPWADEFVPALIATGHPVRLATRDAPWRDVGTWYRLWLAHRDLTRTAPNHQHIHPTAQVAPTARITGWAYLGPNTRVGQHCAITNSAVLTGADLADHSTLSDGLALPRAHVPAGIHQGTVHLRNAAPAPMPQAPHT